MMIKKSSLIILIACLMSYPVFLYGAVAGQDQFPLSVEENKDSVVKLFALNPNNPTQGIQYGTGFLVENDKPDYVTVTTVAHFFLIPFLTGEPFEFIMEYKGKTVSLDDREFSFDPLQDMAFVHIPKEELEEGQSVKPLAIRKTPLRSEESLYTMGFPFGYFCRIQATDIKPHPPHQGDFAFMLNRTEVGGASGAPLMDQEGKLVLIYKKNYFNSGFGSEVSGLTELMKDASCPGSLRECVSDAGKKLYYAGKAGDSKAQVLILQLGSACPGCFENFMRFVDVYDRTAMQENWNFFADGASKVSLSFLYPRIKKTKNPEEINDFWRRGRPLAEKGYPHIQHILCEAWLNHLDQTDPNTEQISRCFHEPALGGFSQSQWAMAVILFHSDRVAALGWLEKAALQGHRKSCRTIKQLYNRDSEICLEELGCDEVVRIHSTVKEICQDIQLAAMPYIPPVNKYGIFSFSSSPPGISLNREFEGGGSVSAAPLDSSDSADEWLIGEDKDKGHDFSSSLPIIREQNFSK